MEPAERMLTTELRSWWHTLNLERFGGTLNPPVIALSRRAGDLGRWQGNTRTLSLAWSLVVDRTWGEVVAVLEHEMAHQYVDEVLRVHDEPPHGPTFRGVCQERGIDWRAAGEPEPADVRESAVVRRIRKLLALADSPVEAEARAAAAKAFRLMLIHNVSAAETRGTERYTVRQVGGARVRRPKHEQLLAGLLAGHFFVEVTMVAAFDVGSMKSAKAVELAGSSENVELAAWVWDYLLGTGERLWLQHARSTGLRGRAVRHRFLEGVVLGFRDKLKREAVHAAQQEGLVWLGDPALEAFVAARHPMRRAGRRLSLRPDGTMAAGRRAGQDIVLRRPIRERSEGAVRALPGPQGEGG